MYSIIPKRDQSLISPLVKFLKYLKIGDIKGINFIQKADTPHRQVPEIHLNLEKINYQQPTDINECEYCMFIAFILVHQVVDDSFLTSRLSNFNDEVGYLTMKQTSSLIQMNTIFIMN